MLALNCEGCDYCCKGLTWVENGLLRGVAIFPDEAKHFPEGSVFPLYRNGNEVFAWQIAENTCPALVNGRCAIYDSRPLLCKAFPVWNEPLKGLGVSMTRCCRMRDKNEGVDFFSSFSKCFEAAREKLRRECMFPEVTSTFSLWSKSWV